MSLFKPFTLRDKALILSFTLPSGRSNCDLSFSNLFSWRFLYGTEFAVLHGVLVFRFAVEGERFYMGVFPKMEELSPEMQAVVEELQADAEAVGEVCRLAGLCTDTKELLERELPEHFHFLCDRDYCDYLYDREALEILRGKKLQAKRNHVNRFRSLYPDYEYLPLTCDRVEECLQLEAEWCLANNAAEDRALQAERRSMTAALQHFDELDLLGGVLYAGGRIVAFTFGGFISEHTFDVCVEKADRTVEGAYAVINQEFVKRLPPSVRFVNREEDLGLEGLRKAKLSYQPMVLLEKWIGVCR